MEELEAVFAQQMARTDWPESDEAIARYMGAFFGSPPPSVYPLAS